MPDTEAREAVERRQYCRDEWQDVRSEGAMDMAYVGGNPWTPDDLKERDGRPTIAPEEMGQYFNHVINALKANPRGMKFSPVGNGANDKGAMWYQDKAREVEYRSQAIVHYLIAAENAIQRSYGFVRVNTKWRSDRDANQEIWVEGFPDPEKVWIDPDAKMPDSSDMQYALVEEWNHSKEVNKRRDRASRKSAERRAKSGKLAADGGIAPLAKGWQAGDQELLCEHWSIETEAKLLLMMEAPVSAAQPSARMIAPQAPGRPKQMNVFEGHEQQALTDRGWRVVRELRSVDVPRVLMQLTDGREILDERKWPGKYIPIASCYGKILWVPEGGEVKRKILSMTRFGRDPWKAYCYCCSQEMEVLGQVPRATVTAVAGQLDKHKKAWLESMHRPTPFLYYDDKINGREDILPAPAMREYVGGEHLQAIEVVKEGYRRAIQSAMGSNFMPTQAQRRNEKSGKALEKIDNAATQGTYHFVFSYESLIRQVGVIFEDLASFIYDYEGETGTMKADESSASVPINQPNNPDAIDTRGDYLVTVSSAPSSDSEREAADDFMDQLIGNLEQIAQLAGPKVALGILSKSIKLKHMGAIGDAIADMLEPEDFKQKNGEPPNPEVMALQGQIQQMQQQLQAAAMEKQAKVVELQGKKEIVQMQEAAGLEQTRQNNETKLAVQQLANEAKAALESIKLFLEERGRLGTQQHEAAQDATAAAHELRMVSAGHQHEAAIGAADAGHEERMATMAAAVAAEQATAERQSAERASGREHAAGANAQDASTAVAMQKAKPKAE